MDSFLAAIMGLQMRKTDSFVTAFLEVQRTETPRVFEGFLIEMVKESHPLPDKIFDITDEKYIIVSKAPGQPRQSEENDEAMFLSTSCNGDQMVDTSGQVLGSPLELHDYQKDLQLNPIYDDSPSKSNKNRKVLLPIQQWEAGHLLTCYNIGFQEHKEIQPCRLWVVSDGSQKQAFVFRSSHIRYTSGGQASLNSFSVTSEGRLFDTDRLTPVQSVLSERYFHGEHVMSFSSSYCLCGSDDDDDDVSRKVKVTFDWDEDSDILCHPPVHGNAKLSIHVNEEFDGPLSSFYQELCIVKILMEGITEEEVNWPASTCLPRPPEKIKLLISNIQDSKTPDIHKKAEHNSKLIFNIAPCQDVDFTDEVWKVMKECSSYQELIDCFQYLFEALHAKRIKPMLGSNNKSSLAQLIRSAYNSNVRKEAAAWLKDEKPLVMLAEIGIEKLKKDYLHIFMTSKIVTVAQLAYFLGHLESDGLPEKVSKLIRIHRVLELCLLLDRNLMQRSSLIEVLSSSLKYYEAHDTRDDLERPFEMQISVLSLIEQVKKTSPTFWKCSITGTQGDGQQIQGCVLLSRNPLFHHVDQNIQQEPSEDSSHLYYHMIVGNETVSCV